MWARVLYEFRAEYQHELSVKPGQMLQVHPASLAPLGWALADRAPDRGIVPPKFFLILPEKQQALQEKAVADAQASGTPQPAAIAADPASYGVGGTGRSVLMAVFIALLAVVFYFVYQASKREELPPHLTRLDSAGLQKVSAALRLKAKMDQGILDQTTPGLEQVSAAVKLKAKMDQDRATE